MTNTTPSNRVPLAIAIAAALILAIVGGYIFWQKAPAVERGSTEQKTELAASAADSAVAAAGMSDEQRTATEALVRAYILENPEVITEAVEILQQREIAQRLTAAGDGLIASPRPFPVRKLVIRRAMSRLSNLPIIVADFAVRACPTSSA